MKRAIEESGGNEIKLSEEEILLRREIDFEKKKKERVTIYQFLSFTHILMLSFFFRRNQYGSATYLLLR